MSTCSRVFNGGCCVLVVLFSFRGFCGFVKAESLGDDINDLLLLVLSKALQHVFNDRAKNCNIGGPKVDDHEHLAFREIALEVSLTKLLKELIQRFRAVLMGLVLVCQWARLGSEIGQELL